MKKLNFALALTLLLLAAPFSHADEMGTGRPDPYTGASAAPAPQPVPSEPAPADESEDSCLAQLLLEWFGL